MRIVLASKNPGKIVEMRELLDGLNVELVSAADVGYTDEIAETGSTFAENARVKARAVWEVTGEWTLADDSGICIDALKGQPGIHTARWAALEGSSLGLAEYTLERMKDVPDGKRQARFESHLVLVSPQGEEHQFRGVVNGTIPRFERGVALPKLPYDTVFVPEGETRTFGELPREIKNSMSHRGRAFAELKKFLNP